MGSMTIMTTSAKVFNQDQESGTFWLCSVIIHCLLCTLKPATGTLTDAMKPHIEDSSVLRSTASFSVTAAAYLRDEEDIPLPRPMSLTFATPFAFVRLSSSSVRMRLKSYFHGIGINFP